MSNVIRAISERVLYEVVGDELHEMLVPKRGVVDEALSVEFSMITRMCKVGPPMCSRDFLAGYCGAKLRTYEKARDVYEERGVVPRDFELSTFIKNEKTRVDHKMSLNEEFPIEPDVRAYGGHASKLPSPRPIQARSPVAHYALGRYTKVIEPSIYRVFKRIFKYPVVMKGYNAIQVGTHIANVWSRFSDPFAIMLDAHRWDQHVNVSLLEWEHRVYRALMPYPELRKLLRFQINNKGSAHCVDGTVKYSMLGRRCSGDMNTALGNCLLMVALTMAYMRSCGVPIGGYHYFNNGDDGILILNREDRDKVLSAYKDWFAKLGVVMKLEGTTSILEHITFCQTSPVWTPLGYLMVRDPRTAMAKDLLSLKPLNSEKTFNTLRATISLGGLSLTRCVPVWSSFYLMLGRGAGNRVDHDGKFGTAGETGFQRMAEGMPVLPSTIDPKTRSSYALAFDCPPCVQYELEARLDAYNITYKIPTTCAPQEQMSGFPW